VPLDDGIGDSLDVLMHVAAFRLGWLLDALAGAIEVPAVERAAQAVVLAPPVAEVGAAMRAMPADQAELACIVAEEHKPLAEQVHRHDRTRRYQFFAQRRRLPAEPHHGACTRAGPDPGQEIVLLLAHHGAALLPSMVSRLPFAGHCDLRQKIRS